VRLEEGAHHERQIQKPITLPQAFQSPRRCEEMREYTAPRLSMFSKPWLYSSGGERSRAHLQETSEGEARGRRVSGRK